MEKVFLTTYILKSDNSYSLILSKFLEVVNKHSQLKMKTLRDKHTPSVAKTTENLFERYPEKFLQAYLINTASILWG